MSFNAVDAAKMLSDEVLSDEEVKYFVSLRGGRAEEEIKDDEEYKTLMAMGLVQGIAFTHPRATLSIQGIIPTEEGVTLMNVIDQRYRENAITPIEPYDQAPLELEPATVRVPTEQEKQEVATTQEGKEKAIERFEGTDELTNKRNELAVERENTSGVTRQSEELMQHVNPADPRTLTIEEAEEVGLNGDRTIAKGATVKVEGDTSKAPTTDKPQSKNK